MKKIVRANMSSTGVLNKASTLAGLQMFRNTPRSPTDLSPAQIIFGHHIRDCLPAHREQLVPQQRYEIEKRLQEVRQFRKPLNTDKFQRELPLLYPGQLVRIQDPRTKRWNKTGTILNFGKNDREYLVRIDNAVYRRNRIFLKPKDVESSPPVRQPAQAPAKSVLTPSPSTSAQVPPAVTAPLIPSPTPSTIAQVPPAVTEPSMPFLMPATSQQVPPAAPSTPTPAIGRPKRTILKPVRFRD